MPRKQKADRAVHLSDRQGILRQSTPLPTIPTVESAITLHSDCRISSPCPTRPWTNHPPVVDILPALPSAFQR